MMYWISLVFAVFLLSCGGSRPSLEEAIPASVDGWTRTQATPLPASDVPEMIRQLGLDQAISATYAGPAAISVKIFRMKGQTSAFELIQKWRQSDGLAVYSGPYFIVADPAAGPDAKQLLQSLRKDLR